MNTTRKTYTDITIGNSGPFAVADINGDGNPDLLIGDNGFFIDGVTVLLGSPNGTFIPGPFSPYVPYPESIGVADINGDGKPDMLVTGYNRYGRPPSQVLGMFLGTGDGSFKTEHYFNLAAPEVLTTDINGDGIPDRVTADYSGVSVMLGNPDGSFQPLKSFEFGQTNTTFDANGDGRPDGIQHSEGAWFATSNLTVLLSNTDASFTGQTYIVSGLLDTITAASGYDQITLTRDIDGDHIDWSLNNAIFARLRLPIPKG